MTFRELEAWRAKHNVPDTWWVSINGVVQEETFPLALALQIKSQQPDAHVALLNNIYATHPNPTWVELTLQPVQLTRAPFQGATPGATNAPVTQAEPVKPAATQPAQQPAATQPAAATASAPAAAIPADFLEKFNKLAADFESMKKEVADLRKIADTYKDSFAEAKAILDEREEFLNMSEAQLFEKAQKQEVRNTELDQREENVSKREKMAKEAEARASGSAG